LRSRPPGKGTSIDIQHDRECSFDMQVFTVPDHQVVLRTLNTRLLEESSRVSAPAQNNLFVTVRGNRHPSRREHNEGKQAGNAEADEQRKSQPRPRATDEPSSAYELFVAPFGPWTDLRDV
jgi:hypothetical protein